MPSHGVSAVAALQDAVTYHVGAGRAQVIRPAHPGSEVQECGGQVVPLAKFGRLVVPRKRVVVIVPALAHGR